MRISQSISIRSIGSVLVVATAGVAHAQSMFQWHTEDSNALLGTSVAAAGDFNGDSIPDTIAGGPGVSKAFVYSGLGGQKLAELSGGPMFGRAVLGGIDFDGDGDSEVLVAQPWQGGVVAIYRGGDGSLLREISSPTTFEFFGRSLCHAGDIDGDGSPEIAIGSPMSTNTMGFTGRIYFYSYAKNKMIRILSEIDPITHGLGALVAEASDIDGDGVTDIAAAVGYEHADRAVRFYSGATGFLVRSIPAPSAALGFGASIAVSGPISSNGHPTLIVGAPEENSFRGAVYRFDAVTEALIDRIEGEPGAEFGRGVAVSERPGQPGDRMLYIGAPASPSVPGTMGCVFAYDGPSGTQLAAFYGKQFTDEDFGLAVAAVGDRNNDGRPEFAVGAPSGISGTGACYVFNGVVACGAIKSLGAGCFGSFGITPKLTLEGCPRSNYSSSLELGIEDGPHVPTIAWVLFGTGTGKSKLNPFCTLEFSQLVGSPLAVPITPAAGGLPYSIGTGHFATVGTVAPLPYPITLRIQAIVIDTGTPFGFSMTNAVEMSFAF